MALKDPTGQPSMLGKDEFVQSQPPNVVKFTLVEVPPPSSIYIQRDDLLVLSCSSGNPLADVVTVSYRLLQPDGRIQIGQRDLAVPNSGALVTLGITLQEGFLLAVSVVASVTAVRGNLYARLTLNRGGTAAAQVVQSLYSDYITATTPGGWPGGPIASTFAGYGAQRVAGFANPAAGAEWSGGVAAPNFVWRLVSGRATLVTSAAVATRIPQLQIDDGGGNIVGWGAPNSGVLAATTVQIAYNTVVPAFVVGGPITVAIPINCEVPTGFVIRSSTIAIQAGDQYSAIEFLVEQWVDL